MITLETKDTKIIEKTKELCEVILGEEQFKSLRGKIDAFMADNSAQEQYSSVLDKREYLAHSNSPTNKSKSSKWPATRCSPTMSPRTTSTPSSLYRRCRALSWDTSAAPSNSVACRPPKNSPPKAVAAVVVAAAPVVVAAADPAPVQAGLFFLKACGFEGGRWNMEDGRAANVPLANPPSTFHLQSSDRRSKSLRL